nr:hypothetical protein [Tanacetum cinerariifolium]
GFRDLNEEFEECFNNSSNGVNAAGSSVFAAGLNFTNNTIDFSAAGPSNAAMPNLEDLSYNADDVGAEADINNMESIISVSPIPTTRIHKDHPTSQIIGDLSSTTQTRSMARAVRDQEEEVYICQPPRFEDPEYPDKVYKVVKALYGLHQAPRAWYETLATYLLENRFQRGTIDQTLFIKKQQKDILLVQIYVNDIIFGATNKALCQSFEKLMKDKFQMSSMGELTFFLGKSASTPIDGEKPLLKDSDGEYVDVHTYRSMIGSLMYLTSSRPDIMFVVCACARFQVTPKVSHLNAVKRIFRYLKGKPYLGLWYPKDLPFDLVAYSDSDYTGVNTPRSDEDRLKLMEFMVFLLQRNVCVKLGINAARLSKLLLSGKCDAAVAAAVVEDVAEDVAHMATPSPPPNGISSPTQEPSSPPYLPHCPPQPQDAEGLENNKAAQQLEIVKLKARVKKLKKINKVKYFKLRRLKKVGTSQSVESSDDMENVFNQGRLIVDMDQDEGIEQVADQEKDAEFEGRHADKQAEIYNIDLDHSSKVLSMQEDDTEVQEAVEIVTTANLMTEVVTVAATQVAAASIPIHATKPKILTITAAPAVSTRRRKGVIIRNPREELPSDTPAETPKVKDKGKGILIEAPKPMKKKDQIEMDAEEEMEAEDEEIIKIINETPAQKAAKRRKLSEEAKEAEDLRKRLEIVQDEDDDVFVEATPLAQKVPVVDYQIVVIDNKPRYKIKRADDTHQLYISFTTLLKNFDREDLEALWKIVRDRFSTSKPTNFSDEYLLLTLKTIFEEPNGQDAIWRNQKSVHGLALVKRWKLLTSCGIHVITLSTVQLFLLVERRYPLSRFTLEQLVNVARLQVEEESEMSLELPRFTRQQLQEYQQG